MASPPSEKFRCHTTRIDLTGGLTRRQASTDLRFSVSILEKRITACRETDVIRQADQELNGATARCPENNLPECPVLNA